MQLIATNTFQGPIFHKTNELISMSDRHQPVSSPSTIGACLLSAAITLPLSNLLTETANAESAPEKSLISFKYLDYLDRQPGVDRIKVKAPSLLYVKPISSEWSISTTYTTDTISGASPAYHTSALKNMHDQRHGLDLSLTHYNANGTHTFGGNFSKEVDYLSKGLFYSQTSSNESKNSTWNAGIALSNDQINPTNQIVANETKQALDLIGGITQIYSTVDIAQYQIGHYSGKGYFSDPYKIFDNRPRQRTHNTFLAKWNHYFESLQSTMRLSYRYYNDDWGIQAHTLEAEYVKNINESWTLAPALRIYSQSAANFFINADNSSFPFAPNPPAGTLNFSEDQRMSAFGAHTIGFKVTKSIDLNTSFDLKIESYAQRAGWRIGGAGSPGLDPFMAKSIQVGIQHYFD
jgi:hypothetical protein